MCFCFRVQGSVDPRRAFIEQVARQQTGIARKNLIQAVLRLKEEKEAGERRESAPSNSAQASCGEDCNICPLGCGVVVLKVSSAADFMDGMETLRILQAWP